MTFLNLNYLLLGHILCIFSPCLNALQPIGLDTPVLSFPKEDFPTIDDRLKKGDECCEAGLYGQAVALYEEILAEQAFNSSSGQQQDTDASLQTLMQANFHLSLAFFSQNEPQRALAALRDNILLDPATLSPQLESVRRNSLYLQALIQMNLKEYELASDMLTAYMGLTTPPVLSFADEARFELGLAAFHLKNYSEATKNFYSLAKLKEKPRLSILSTLYLARISLANNQLEAATRALENLTSKVSSTDPLYFELQFLRGQIAFQQHEYTRAIALFNSSLPSKQPEKYSWYPDTMYQVGWCFLKSSEDIINNTERLADFLNNAENSFNKFIAATPEEKGYLALAQTHLSRVKRLKTNDAYAKAEAILSNDDYFKTHEAKAHVLLLRAEAAPTYEIRDSFYRKLTGDENKDSTLYPKGWYMRALNDFEYGLYAQQSGDFESGKKALQTSADTFERSFMLFKNLDSAQACAAIKYQALAHSHLGNPSGDLKAFQLIDSLRSNYPALWKEINNHDEMLYLHGYFAGRLAQKEPEKYLPIASNSLKAVAAQDNTKFGDQALNYLGTLYFQMGDYPEAEAVYLQLTDTYPLSSLSAEGWYWSARCADLLNKDREIGKQRRRLVFENHPTSPYAGEAYFTLYTYQDYLQGERGAIKHLQNFENTYPETPFLIEAYYLIGLDYKRDRKNPDGKWIRKKSLTEAIDAFQQAETLFDHFAEKGMLPNEKLEYYAAIRYRATLDRAMANLAIAEEGQGAKQQIYLDYAEEVFETLVADLNKPHNPSVDLFFKNNPQSPLLEESLFGLAKTYIQAKNDEKADSTLTQLLDRHSLTTHMRGYFPARAWDEKGNIALRRKDYATALQCFKQAEEASKGNVLSTDQKLDLWIHQSLCHRGMEQYDEAVLILSKVVNDDAVSSLRLKAMYLRAETYEEQGRHELARKQLESMVKKGGSWARKAKEKLEKDYGY